jgi:hypothetical protein
VRWWLLLLAGCVTATPVKLAPKVELYVDGSAAEGGDGSVDRPFRTLTLREGATVHVASGLYPFSGALPPGVEVVGQGEVVLYAEGDAPVVLSAVSGRLKGLSLQGGQWGLEVSGDVELEHVKFSGQRQGCVHLRMGSLALMDGELQGTLPDTLGLRAEPHTVVELHGVRFSGAFKRAVDVENATARIDRLRSDGPAQAVHAVGGKTLVQDSTSKRGSGTAFSMTRGSLQLERIEVVGHEYAVLAGDGDVTLRRLTSDRAAVGALALMNVKADISDLRVTHPGTHGAVESLDSTTQLSDVYVTDAVDQAVLARKGSLTARRVEVTRLRGLPGDAVHIRDAHAVIEGVVATDVESAGVGVTAVADAEVRDVRCTRCGHGALVVDRRSHVRARGIVMLSGDAPAVYAGDDAQVEASDVDAAGKGPAVWAECEGATHVSLSGRVPPRERLSGGCVEVK